MIQTLSFSLGLLGLLGALFTLLAIVMLLWELYDALLARARATLWRTGWEELAAIGITRRVVVVWPPEPGDVA